ncbi:MAG: molybdopterin converting factor subunit 1 [Thiohalobacterales bacterium]|nr:molybdopterin converting factor subunit 1 [Thiohalobacterales bacterium]
MVQLLYFASLRETLGTGNEQIELPDHVHDVAALMKWLQARDDTWHNALSNPQLLVAVNQEMAAADTAIRDGDEIAWFPPVTGG